MLNISQDQIGTLISFKSLLLIHRRDFLNHFFASCNIFLPSASSKTQDNILLEMLVQYLICLKREHSIRFLSCKILHAERIMQTALNVSRTVKEEQHKTYPTFCNILISWLTYSGVVFSKGPTEIAGCRSGIYSKSICYYLNRKC